MKTTITAHEHVSNVAKYNVAKRYMLRRFHPKAILIDSVGALWLGYLFWVHDWKSALTTFLIFRIISFVSTIEVNPEAIATSRLGKIALLHLHPLNMATQAFGIIVLLYGLWDHSDTQILAGISFLLLGHLAGWGKVDSRFRNVK